MQEKQTSSGLTKKEREANKKLRELKAKKDAGETD